MSNQAANVETAKAKANSKAVILSLREKVEARKKLNITKK
jgi:hypothetical protein